MKLYAVTFKADVEFGKDIFSDHEVIIPAPSPEEAERSAIQFFIKNGKWTKIRVGGMWITNMSPDHFRITGRKELEFLACINERVIEKRP